MHSMLVGSGCIYPSLVESFAWFFVHLQPVVIVIVCHAIATDGGVGGVLDHGLCLAWIHVSVSVLLELVVWKPLCLDPSDGVFGRFDLAALGGCHTLNFCCCLRCGNRQGLLGRTDQTHHRMDPKHNGFHTTKQMDTRQVFTHLEDFNQFILRIITRNIRRSTHRQ